MPREHGSSAGSRVILHADMDAFYASVEQRDRPELRGRPVIVGGTGARGVVSAASYEARRFGVHSAMPTFEARRRCPSGVFLPGDMRRYVRESERVFAIFGRFAPAVEGISLDEAFLDLTGTERLMGPPAGVGAALRAAVRAELGLAVSVGIAPIKLAAKIASDLAKPDGLVEVSGAGLRAFLSPLPIARVWGLGPVAQERCARAGIFTIGDLVERDPRKLEAALGPGVGAWIRLAHGEDPRDVEPDRAAVSYSEENTFAADVVAANVLEGALIAHAESVARRLRRDRVRARVIAIKLKLGRRVRPGPRGFPALTRRRTLADATDDGYAISQIAIELLHAAAVTEPIRLIGVGASGLETSGGQLELLPPPEAVARRRRLNGALDQITDRFGSAAIVRGTPQERASLSHQRKRGGDA